MPKTFPYLLLWLVLKPPDALCEQRMEAAGDLLRLGDDALGLTTCKVRNLFRPQLEQCAQTGQLDTTVWSFLENVAMIWWLDTEAVEGINSVVKAIHRSAPSIKWMLMGSRVMNKKNVRGRDLAALVFACVQHHTLLPEKLTRR